MWVLLVEDRIPDQGDIVAKKLDLVFPPGPGRPAELAVRCAQRGELALERVGLDPKFACDEIPAELEALSTELRGELTRKAIPTGVTGLYGISCDLEIPCAYKQPAIYHSGLNLVRLFSHWRTLQGTKSGASFQLVVCSLFAHLEPDVAPFCDRFISK